MFEVTNIIFDWQRHMNSDGVMEVLRLNSLQTMKRRKNHVFLGLIMFYIVPLHVIELVQCLGWRGTEILLWCKKSA